MYQIARLSMDEMRRYFWARRVIEGYVLINDSKELKKVLRYFEQDTSVKICSFHFLRENGFEKEAIKAAKDEIVERIEQLESMRYGGHWQTRFRPTRLAAANDCDRAIRQPAIRSNDPIPEDIPNDIRFSPSLALLSC